MYVPDVRGRIEEGAQKHEYRLEDLERAEEKARHVRAVGGRSRRWLWELLGVCCGRGSVVRDLSDRSSLRINLAAAVGRWGRSTDRGNSAYRFGGWKHSSLPTMTHRSNPTQ